MVLYLVNKSIMADGDNWKKRTVVQVVPVSCIGLKTKTTFTRTNNNNVLIMYYLNGAFWGHRAST